MNTDQSFQFGVRLGYVSAGHDTADVVGDMAKAATMRSPEAEPFNRELCKIAAAAFEAAGEGDTVEANLFRNLAVIPVWDRGYNRFTDSVKRGLAKGANATIIPAAAAAAVSKTGLVPTVMGASVLGGGALGSLAFLLSRNARQTSAENSAILEKVRAYKELSRDIREDMHEGGLEEDREEGTYDV